MTAFYQQSNIETFFTSERHHGGWNVEIHYPFRALLQQAGG
jgi:hypothetical protein